ncbi:MAG: ABC transporter substrate-binding protein [Chloroflexota bacterium]
MFSSSRRLVLKLALGAGATGLLAACGQQAPAPKAEAPKPAEAAKPAAPQVAVPTPPQAAPAQAAAKPTEAPAPAKPAEAAKPAAAAKRGGTLKLHRQNDWPTLDPHTAQTSSLDMPLVYDYLTRIDRNPANGAWEVKPSLAASWELPDPQTVLMKLRPNVKFHDGTDFNADAAKWNLERMINHPKSAAKVHTSTIDKIEVVDPTTLRLKLKAPSPVLFVNLSSDADNATAMISPTWAEKVGDAEIAKSSVGTGPFKLAEYQPSNQITYKRWDGYWKNGADGKPLPYVDEVTVKYQQDWNAALVQLRSGEYDMIIGFAGKDVPTVQSAQNLVYRPVDWQATMYQIVFNAKEGKKFAGEKMKKVRQAILYAIDREAMAKALGGGIGAANYYHLVPGQVGYSDKVPKYSFDLAKAKQLMAEAGFASGLEVTMDFISRPEDTQNAQLYQQMLAQIGVKINLQPSERVAWVQKTLAGDYDMGTFLSGVRPDPDLVLGYRFAKGGPGNYSLWESADLNKLLDEGRVTYDTAKRQEAYEKAQAIITDEAYVGFIWRRSGTIATNKALQGFDTSWAGYMTNSTEMWLDK